MSNLATANDRVDDEYQQEHHRSIDNVVGMKTSYEPICEGSQDSSPQHWKGIMSGTPFKSEWKADVLVLTFQLDAVIPLQISDAMVDEERLQVMSALYDLALKISGDTTPVPDDVEGNAIGLAHVRDYFLQSHLNLTNTLKDTRSRMEVSRENILKYDRSAQSIDTLLRIATRIDDHLKSTLRPQVYASLLPGAAVTQEH